MSCFPGLALPKRSTSGGGSGGLTGVTLDGYQWPFRTDELALKTGATFNASTLCYENPGAVNQTANIVWGTEGNYVQEDVKGSFTFTVGVANTSGNFSADVSSSKIKAGCRMKLGSNEVTITSITGAGTAANSVTFSGTAPTQTNTTPTYIYGSVFSSGVLKLSTYQPATSYANTGGTGDRTATITCSTDITLGGGTLNNCVDGATAGSVADAIVFPTASNSGKYVRFAWASPVYIDEIKWYQSSATAQGDWKVQAYNGSSWVDVSSTFTVSGTTTTITITSPGSYSQWQFVGVSGSTSAANYGITEVEFKIGTGTASPVSTYYTTITSTDQLSTSSWTDVNGVTVTETLPYVQGTTDICSGGTATASVQNTGNEADKAFNDITTVDTGWAYTGGSSWWLRYQLTASKAVWKYRLLVSHSTIMTSAPKSWTFEGSNDGSTWNTLDTQSNITSWVNGTWKEFSVSSPVSYLYYRVNISANNGAGFILITEVEMYEQTYPGTTYYSLSFDSRNTFKVFTSGAWRSIASNLNSVHGGTNGTWYYRDNASTWAAASSSNANTALSQAVAAGANNQMSGSALAGISDANWEVSGGWAAGTLDVGVTLYTTNASNNPQVDNTAISYDVATQDMTLRTASVSADYTPSGAVILFEQKPVSAMTMGIDCKVRMSRDGGTSWTPFQTSIEPLTVMPNGFYLYSAKMDLSTCSPGTDIVVEFQTYNTKEMKFNAITLLWLP